jgi:hypothetical protein
MAFIRSSLQESSGGGTNLSPFQSPDIIPLDKHTLEDLSFYAETYNRFVSRPLRQGISNNIYVRAAKKADVRYPFFIV